ncbi:MAG: hypothetical protein ACOYWZ_00035 [Bacillota bacterium]
MIRKAIVNENVAIGDGSTKIFYLQNQNIIDETYTIYLDAVAKSEPTDYSLDKDKGKITFVVAPLAGVAITSDYWYSNVSDSHLENVIYRAEDKIDELTRHAWRLRYSGTHSGQDTTSQYIYKTMKHISYWNTGIPVDMGHRKIKTLDKTKDKIEIWVGNWEDLLQTGTEGRDKDFWVDYDQGILFIRKWYFQMNQVQVRLQYRYGDNIVPYSIEDLCIKIAARDLLISDDRSILLPEGTTNIPLETKINILNRDIEQLLGRYKEVVAVM